MKKFTWGSRLAAAALALAMLLGCAFAESGDEAVVLDLTEETAAPDEPAAEDAAAEEATVEEPVLLASVNGDEIWSNNDAMKQVYDYYTDYFESYGYDVNEPGIQALLQNEALKWAIQSTLYHQKAEQLGVTVTEADEEQLKADLKKSWDDTVEEFMSYIGGATQDSTEEELAQARQTALEYIEATYGYTEESYIAEFLQDAKEQKLLQEVQDKAIGPVEVTDDEVTAYFNELVEEDKEQFEGNVAMYEYSTQYMGGSSYYMPEGYKGITHILLAVDPELMENYTNLSAQLEEQEEGEIADEAGEETAEAGEETAEAAPEETKEPVTQEMVDAAYQAIMDSVKPQVDEIMAKLNAGTPFADLVAEYGTDPGMTVEPTKSEGYSVHPDSIMFDSAFTEGAKTLQKVGDVSDPVLSQFGVHILYYNRDVPAGAVELTDEIKEALKEDLLSDKESEAASAMVEAWIAEAEIIYTNEGQAILDAAVEAEAEEESVETTEATEEVLSE